jgi:hypothetical protein
MQTVSETLPRKLRIRLEGAQDLPVEIDWQEDERLVTPKAEIFYDGRLYQPQRTEREKKAGIKIIPAESFTAVIDQELKDLWASGKISLPMPFLDRGYTREGRIPAYRPWPNSGFDSGGSDFGDCLVKVRMRPQLWRQIFPGLPGREILPGMVFYTTWAVARALGFHQMGGALELVE